MTTLLTIPDLCQLIHKHGFEQLMKDLIAQLTSDLLRREEFSLIPRPAFHVEGGVIELMPICDSEYFSYKYVNGHPTNPEKYHELTIMATGQLSETKTGKPLLISELTISTALRTAAMSCLATDYMARKNSHHLAIIGTGAQSEFQCRSHTIIRNITTISYYDTDPKAMEKFAANMQDIGNISLIACTSAEEAVKDADIIITCTACKKHGEVLQKSRVKPGTHISALGGDCPGKTELSLDLLLTSTVVVEYFDQSFIEGEIQRLKQQQARDFIYGELHEVIKSDQSMRISDDEITVFDSVGIALADYSMLVVLYKLAQKYGLGTPVDMIPTCTDVKDLWSFVK